MYSIFRKCSVIFLLLTNTCWATTVSFQQGVSGYTGTTDNHAKENDPTTNNGGATSFEITNYDTNDRTNTFIKWDLSSISPGITCNSVTIELYQESGTGTSTIQAYRLLRDWSESQSTWNLYSTGNGWQTAGGYGANDSSATLTVSASVNDVAGFKTFGTSAQLCTDVENFVNGTWTNYGWTFRSQTLDFNPHYFFSSEDATNPPRITIDYTAGGGALRRVVLVQ